VLPLDARGHGAVIGAAVRGALRLHDALGEAVWDPFVLAMLPRPDMNIVCCAITHPALGTLEATNDFVRRVYGAMSVDGDDTTRRLDYLVTKTTLRVHEYGHAVDELLARLGYSYADYERAGGLAVIRCTVMNPFLVSAQGKVDHFAGFVRTLGDVMRAQLPAAASPGAC
jgi:hypothetical protein